MSAWASGALWQQASWVLAHVLWSAAAVGLGAGVLRRLTRACDPQVRSAVAQGCFLALALLPLAWWCAAPPDVVVDASPMRVAHAVPPSLFASTPLETVDVEVPSAGWTHVLPVLWLIGLPWAVIRLAVAFWSARTVRRTFTLASVELHERCRFLAQRVGVAPVPVLLSDTGRSPFVQGVLRPCIVLPWALAEGLRPDQLDMALLHELSHLRRLDPWFEAFQRVVEAVLFFHPAVWWVSAWVRREREACCDAAVLRAGARPRDYAALLLALAERPSRMPGLAMAAGPLRSRIEGILGQEERVMVPWTKSLVLVALAATVTLTWSSSPSAQSWPAQETKQEAEWFVHSAHAGMDLSAVSCSACHVGAVEPIVQAGTWHQESPQSGHAEWVKRFHAVHGEASCVQCHVAGSAPRVPRAVAATDCASCHVAGSVDPLGPSPHGVLGQDGAWWQPQPEIELFDHSQLAEGSRCTDCHLGVDDSAFMLESAPAWTPHAPMEAKPETPPSTDGLMARDPGHGGRFLWSRAVAGVTEIHLVDTEQGSTWRIDAVRGDVRELRWGVDGRAWAVVKLSGGERLHDLGRLPPPAIVPRRRAWH